MGALLANPAVLLAAIVLAAMLTYPNDPDVEDERDDDVEDAPECVVCGGPTPEGDGCEFCPRVES